MKRGPALKALTTCLVLLMISGSMQVLKGQGKNDSLIDDVRERILGKYTAFTFGFYIEAYDNLTFGGKKDTSNVVPFSGNCPIHEQIRLNVAALELYYNADKVRGKLVLQYGDAPNLLAVPQATFIKNMRQANFGFRIVKDLWIDAGYMLNPVGYESSWSVINQISTVSIGGYYEPGSVLGVKLTYKFSEKFNGGVMVGDPYSLAYEQNTNIAGMIFFNYSPVEKLKINYNSFFGNQALKTAEIKNNVLYNNLIISYVPVKDVLLVGQLDVGAETNSKLPPDTTKIAYMYSGFFQAGYSFLKHFSVNVRYEFFNDPDGFLSGEYTYDGKTTGLQTRGFGISFEYKPVKIGFVRLEYKYLEANHGNTVFYSNTSDNMQAVVITTGVRF
jgi:hypothetical protein